LIQILQKKKLILGPQVFLLKANEEYYNKKYSDFIVEALGISKIPSYNATVVRLELGEVICVLDENKNETIINGPQQYILGPDEYVKCLWLSAKKPKVPNQIKAAKIKIGPDFVSDTFEVRTKDNAQLSLSLTYKWEFLVDDKDSYKLFTLQDFIGYSCGTLCSKN